MLATKRDREEESASSSHNLSTAKRHDSPPSSCLTTENVACPKVLATALVLWGWGKKSERQQGGQGAPGAVISNHHRKFGGLDCDRCVADLVNYPACTPKALTVPARHAARQPSVSSSITLISGVPTCSCASCVTPSRVCSTNATTGVKSKCIYPLYACQKSVGSLAPTCAISVGGKNVWSPCGPC